MIRSSKLWKLPPLGLGLLALTCANIVGIEDAELDTTAGRGGEAGSNAGNAGQGGLEGGTGGQPGGGEAGDGTGGEPQAGETGQGGLGGQGGDGTEGGAVSEAGNAGAAGTGGDGNAGEGGVAGAAGAVQTAGAAGAPPEQDQEALCADYCDAVMAHCVDEYQVYTSPERCLAVCLNLELGDSGDTSGNTLSCRLTEAYLAAEESPETHCPAAGPGGDDVCGSNCEGFCGLMAVSCPTEFAEVYESEPVLCETACNDNWDDLGGYNSSISTGPTVQCLLWHVSAAADVGGIHCTEHSIGIGPCDPAG